MKVWKSELNNVRWAYEGNVPSDKPIHQLNNLNVHPNIDLNILGRFCHIVLSIVFISIVTLVGSYSSCVNWKTLCYQWIYMWVGPRLSSISYFTEYRTACRPNGVSVSLSSYQDEIQDCIKAPMPWFPWKEKWDMYSGWVLLCAFFRSLWAGQSED